jgi:hypothetical protein
MFCLAFTRGGGVVSWGITGRTLTIIGLCTKKLVILVWRDCWDS